MLCRYSDFLRCGLGRWAAACMALPGMLVCLISVCLVLAEGASASSVEVPLLEDDSIGLGQSRDALRLASANGALAGGYPALALQLLAPENDDPHWSEDHVRAVWLTRLRAWIARGELNLAMGALRDYPLADNDSLKLLEAAITFGLGDKSRSYSLLEEIQWDTLSPGERSWHALLNAHRLQAEGDLDGAAAEFQRAADSSTSPVLRANFEIIRLRQELNAAPPSEIVISGLRESTRSLQGEVGGFEAARLLAIALAQSGRSEDAIALIDRQLQLPGIERSGLRPKFLLLMGLIAGEQSGKGQLALRQLLTEAVGNQRILEPALQLLARSSWDGMDRTVFLAQLGQWLDSPRPHPLRDQMLALRAYIFAAGGSLLEAESDALMLLESYPASPLVNEALRLMAYTSWSREPPRYRTAAGYLNRLRQRLPPGPESVRLGIVMADCYFLNGDYVSASDAYGSLQQEQLSEGERMQVIFQRVQAEIGAGRLDRARELLNNPGNQAVLSAEVRWKAEWNLLDALKRQQDMGTALARVNRLLAEGEERRPDAAELRLRMTWLRARLTLEVGDPLLAKERTEALLEQLSPDAEDSPYRNLPADLLENVRSHSLMLLGESQFANGDHEAGRIIFQSLRNRHPGSGPAILSYLIEARDAARGEALVNAQQSLIQLADLFPDSRYAPIALWEAAIHAEQRGINDALREAISILERLLGDYAEHELAFYARLKQGDILRRLNDFGTALILYERLIRAFPNHPERYRAEMSRADCLLAQGSQTSEALQDAMVAYERLVFSPLVPADLQVEALYKAGLCHRLLGDRDEQAATLWTSLHRYFGDDAEQYEQLGPVGRYWLGRGLLELATYIERYVDISAALRIYQLIEEYQLPGSAIANARINMERIETP